MAELSIQEADVPIAFRRVTRDLKDVQDALKSVVESSGQFVERHASINEEEEKEASTPILILKPYLPVNKKGAHQDLNKKEEAHQDLPSIMISENHADSKDEGQDPQEYNQRKRETSPPSTTPDATDGGGITKKSHHHHSDRPAPPIYGELVVLGTNGSLQCQAISPKMTHRYVLKKQPRPTGVSQIVKTEEENQPESRQSTHTVSMTMAKNRSCVMEFGPDPRMDMFQIGRSVDSAIDLVVMDTVDNEEGSKVFNSNSTVSRYACRILVERVPPYTARIYAAAFDTKRRIQLSPMAPTWIDVNGDSDGLTTNGVAILRPVGSFESGVEPGQWMEVTVMGNIRKMRPERSTRTPNSPLPEETNMLTDGCLIDLCGVTLMWRTAMGLDQGLSSTLLRERTSALNKMAPQCPVNMLTLHFRDGKLVPSDGEEDQMREPWVYQECGHVFGQHQWKGVPEGNSTRMCPICRMTGSYIKLQLAQEKAFFVDDGSLSCTFVPCGHVTTEKTAKYWSKVLHPRLSTSWSLCCPFCSNVIPSDTPYIKLLFN